MKKSLYYHFLLIFLIINKLWAIPTIGEFYFDGVKPLGGDSIAAKPVITVSVTPTAGIIFSGFKLYIDGVNVLGLTNYEYDITNGIFTYRVTDVLAEGLRTFELVANDGTDNNRIISAHVSDVNLKMLDKPIALPSPATSDVRICYELTATEELVFLIYDTSGRMIYRRQLAAGEEGAHAGYNFLPYDLNGSDGRSLPNGVYLAFITKKTGDRAILGKTKFIILRENN